MMKYIFRSNRAIFNSNKRGLSAVVAYILLITMAISLSGMVFVWLKNTLDTEDVPQCPDGISLVISDYACNGTSKIINITLKNRGRFTIDGFNLRLHDRVGALQGLYNINESFPTETVTIVPSESIERSYIFPNKTEFATIGTPTLIELQAFMYIDNADERSFCLPIITQTIDC